MGNVEHWNVTPRSNKLLQEGANGVPNSQSTTFFSAKYQLTTFFGQISVNKYFLANSQLTTNFG